MTNPWLHISADDYENHMSDKNVGQTEALSLITKAILEKHQPENLVVLGCSTGNGFEHINPMITSKVYGVDINPDYLEITRNRFATAISDLELICIDINKDLLPMSNANLVLAALVFEYIDIEIAVKKIYNCLNSNGKSIVVLQKNNMNAFVSKTRYKSLQSLQKISSEIDESELITVFLRNNFSFIKKKTYPLSSGKEFIIIEFEKEIIK